MKLILNFILASALLGCTSINALAEGFSVFDGKLYFAGVVVPSEVSFKNYDKNSEVKPLFSSTENDNYSVLKVVSARKYEYWLFDKKTKSMSFVNTYPANLKVSWISDDLFMLLRTHMGTSISILNKVTKFNQLEVSGYIKEFIAVSDNNSLIVSWASKENKLRLSNFEYSEHVFVSVSDEIKQLLDKSAIAPQVSSSQCKIVLSHRDKSLDDLTVQLKEDDCSNAMKIGLVN